MTPPSNRRVIKKPRFLMRANTLTPLKYGFGELGGLRLFVEVNGDECEVRRHRQILLTVLRNPGALGGETSSSKIREFRDSCWNRRALVSNPAPKIRICPN